MFKEICKEMTYRNWHAIDGLAGFLKWESRRDSGSRSGEQTSNNPQFVISYLFVAQRAQFICSTQLICT